MTAERLPFLADLSADFRSLYHANIANDFLLRSPGSIYSSNLTTSLNATLPATTTTQQPIPAPDKITNICISSRGVRYYKIQWQESWLPEHTLLQFQNHQSLVDAYWSKLNTTPASTSVSFQNLLTPTTLTATNVSQKKKATNKNAISQSAKPVNTDPKPVEIPKSTHAINQTTNTISKPQPISNEQNFVFTINVDKSLPITNSIDNITTITDESNKTIAYSLASLREITDSLRLPNEAVIQTTVEEGAPQSEETSTNEFLVIPPVKSKVNSLSQFSTLGSSSKKSNKISIHMENFDLVNIENFTVTEEELKATAIETLNSFKRKRLRLPNGAAKLPQTCFFCLKTISNRKQLREHQFTTHFKNVGDFSCSVCSKRFIYQQQLRDHMITHTDIRQYQCKVCGLTCKRKSHLQKHMTTHNAQKNYRCDVCHENFKVQADLKEHCLSAHSNQVVKCNVCKYTLHTANSVYMHSLRHSGTRDHVCKVCGAGFKLKQHLNGHMVVHAKEKEMFQCPGCTKQFPDKKALKKHFEQQHEDLADNYRYDYKCDICGKEFAYKGRYEEHVKLHSIRNDEIITPRDQKIRVASLSDDVIEKDFDVFEKVTGDNEGEIKLRCKICKNREFRMVSVAQRHQNDHKDGKIVIVRHECNTCGEEFSSRLLLRKHMQSHKETIPKKRSNPKTGNHQQKLLQCKRCQLTFKWKSLLQKHLQTCLAQPNHNRPGSKRRQSTIKAMARIAELSLDVEHVGSPPSDVADRVDRVDREMDVQPPSVQETVHYTSSEKSGQYPEVESIDPCPNVEEKQN